MHAPPRSTPSWLVNLLLSLASVAAVTVVLAGVEAGLRHVDPDYMVHARGLHVYSPVYGWAPRRNVATVLDGQRVTLNARGHRGRDLGPKREDRARVVVIGDSVAFGHDLSDESTFAQILDTRDNGLEVTNLAVQGYGTGQQLIKLEREGLPLAPDVVLLAYCENNDLADTLSPTFLYNADVPKPRFDLGPDGLELEAGHVELGFVRRAGLWLLDHSQLFHRLATLARPSERRDAQLLHSNQDETVHWTERKARLLEREEEGLRLTRALIERMHTRTEAQGGTFVLAVFPGRIAYRRGSRITAVLCEHARSRGIRCVDMAEALSGSATHYRRFASDKIGHLNPAGHRLAADVLEPILTGAARRNARNAPLRQ